MGVEAKMNLFEHPDFLKGVAFGEFLRITQHFNVKHGTLELSVAGEKKKNVPIICSAWRGSKQPPSWQSLS
jgi:hypothetical protein